MAKQTDRKQFNARLSWETVQQIDDIAAEIGKSNTPPRPLSQSQAVAYAIDKLHKELWHGQKIPKKSRQTA